MTTIAVTLTADLPEVIQTPYRIEVSCGETTCDVYEHGNRGSGNWAAWKTTGYTIGEGGRVGYSAIQALEDAEEYVLTQERSRLLHTQLKAQLQEPRP